MNGTQRFVTLLTTVVVISAILMSIFFTPVSLLVLAFILWVIFIVGEGDVGNPYKRVQEPIYIVDNVNLKSQMDKESGERAKGSYYGLKIYIALLGALMFAIAIIYIVFFIE